MEFYLSSSNQINGAPRKKIQQTIHPRNGFTSTSMDHEYVEKLHTIESMLITHSWAFGLELTLVQYIKANAIPDANPIQRAKMSIEKTLICLPINPSGITAKSNPRNAITRG
nr:hypothetical protein [Tanacetum cinerariifolium]